MAKERETGDVSPSDPAPRGGAEEAPAVQAEPTAKRKTAEPLFTADQIGALNARGLLKTAAEPAADRAPEADVPEAAVPEKMNLGGRIGSAIENGMRNFWTKSTFKQKVGCGCLVMATPALLVVGAAVLGTCAHAVTGGGSNPPVHQAPPPPPYPGPVTTSPPPVDDGTPRNMQVEIQSAATQTIAGHNNIQLLIHVVNQDSKDSPDNVLMAVDGSNTPLAFINPGTGMNGQCNYLLVKGTQDTHRLAIGSTPGKPTSDIPPGADAYCSPVIDRNSVQGAIRIVDYSNGNTTQPSYSIAFTCPPKSGACQPAASAAANTANTTPLAAYSPVNTARRDHELA